MHSSFLTSHEFIIAYFGILKVTSFDTNICLSLCGVSYCGHSNSSAVLSMNSFVLFVKVDSAIWVIGLNGILGFSALLDGIFSPTFHSFA